MHESDTQMIKYCSIGAGILCMLATLGGAGLPTLGLFLFFAILTGLFL